MADLDLNSHSNMSTRKMIADKVHAGFTDWAPEDREWLIDEFMKDMGSRYSSAAPSYDFNQWFKRTGQAKAGQRNQSRDAQGRVDAEAQAQAKADQDRAAAEGRQKFINADLDAFYNQLRSPIDPNDPEISRVAQMAGRQAATQSYGSGIEGGLSVANTQSMAGNAAAQMYQAERQRRDALASNVLGMRQSSGLSDLQYQDAQREFRVAQDQYRQGIDYENQMNQWMQGKQANQAGWGLAGGLGGGLLAGLATGGNPMAITAGVTGGSQLAAGLAGANYGSAPQRRYTTRY